MSTSSLTSSPSPSKSVAFWSLVKVLIIPILGVKWAIRCRNEGKAEWIGFALLAVFGIAEILAIFMGQRATFLWITLQAWGLVLYPFTLVGTLIFRAVVKDESKKGPV